jgi:cell division protein FtsW
MDWPLLIAQLLLLSLSLLGVGAAHPTLLAQELFRLAISLLATLAGLWLSLNTLLRSARWIWLLILGLLVLTLAIGEGPGGVHRWIAFRGLSFQPSELAKLGLILLLARGRTSWTDLLLSLSGVILVALEPDLGTAALLASLLLLLLWANGTLSWKGFLSWTAGLASLILLLIARLPYAQARLTKFWRGHVYQIVEAHRTLIQGGLLGHGWSGGMPPLPASYTDMVFAAVVYGGGLLAGGLLLAAYGFLLYRTLRIALGLRGPYRLLILGLAAYLGLQASLNLIVVFGFFPVTGIPLPLVSYGGSSLTVSGLSLGLIQRAALIQRTRFAWWSRGDSNP